MKILKEKFNFYFKLFKSTFFLSAFTFGGGYVIVPLMRKKFVKEYKWIEEEEMLDLTAIAQASPGAMAVNASILVGYRLAGILGAIITIIGTILPPLIILSIISLAYSAFIENIFVKYILKGMQAGVAAVVLDVSVSMITDIFKERKLMPIIVMFAAFIASFFLNINVVIIILLSGLIGIASMYFSKDRRKGAD
ncbi:chromate transporter [Clostridium isatidis]|uniref:chromate transporter n=1 Tax=Clostridium isatidis TaxID=182773 RepID=UPI0030027FEB